MIKEECLCLFLRAADAPRDCALCLLPAFRHRPTGLLPRSELPHALANSKQCHCNDERVSMNLSATGKHSASLQTLTEFLQPFPRSQHQIWLKGSKQVEYVSQSIGHAALFPWVYFHRYWLHVAYDIINYIF